MTSEIGSWGSSENGRWGACDGRELTHDCGVESEGVFSCHEFFCLLLCCLAVFSSSVIILFEQLTFIPKRPVKNDSGSYVSLIKASELDVERSLTKIIVTMVKIMILPLCFTVSNASADDASALDFASLLADHASMILVCFCFMFRRSCSYQIRQHELKVKKWR
jgi:hypothetical protein